MHASSFTGLNAFQRLVRDLSDTLGPSSGIDSAKINPFSLIDLMACYPSHESEWIRYAHKDPSMVFTRNLVDRGNGKSNLLILVWTPGRESVIHDHANAHCVMKVLRGEITETRYEWPTPPTSVRSSPEPCSSSTEGERHDTIPPDAEQMRITKTTTFGRDQVTYTSDELGLHKISNPDLTTFAVTLHLYTPPNAATHGCQVFDEKTGQGVLVTGYPYFSEFGQKTQDECRGISECMGIVRRACAIQH